MNCSKAADSMARHEPFGRTRRGVVVSLGRLRILMLFAFVALTGTQTASAASSNADGGYRLAGVMLVGKDRIGFLEVPAGGQMLVRLGSGVDGGTITVFSDRELRIAFPDRSVVLELSGGTSPPDPGALGVVTGQDDNMHVMVRNVDPQRMTEALERSKPPVRNTVPQATKTDAQAEVGRRFAAVAGLPVNARVTAVNDQPVVSASKAIAAVEKSLAEGIPATLNLESPGNGPPSRVYLLPEPD